MSVSMLLNAANVVTAAERLKAIDEKTGRIPINFLLSRSPDLDENVKDQLQALAAHSSSISILPNFGNQPPRQVDDTVMTDVQGPQSQSQQQQLASAAAQQLAPQQPAAQRLGAGLAHGTDPMDDDFDTEAAVHLAEMASGAGRLTRGYGDSMGHAQDQAGIEADEALKDIDRETGRPDRGAIRRQQRRNQTLTRRAIRKHTSSSRELAKERKSSAKDSSSTVNTVGGSDTMRSSVASSASQHSNTPRRRWKEWEDDLLMRVVADEGPTRWNSLADHFPGRNGRQVRLRWMNHLQPSLDKQPWRPEEDQVLLEAHKDLGNKWALISARLIGRTDNSVKNRYKSIVRRTAREVKASRKQE